ncbi:MAG: T9SS type A sorting domain-containing protein, partial [Candidatus Marinimicrobia bacterium]|nr:T9SS type A sorting domain-containing protein [Candidatus Neomarinimicrobiota bacterium]
WKLVVYTRSNLSASIDWSLLMTTNSNTPIDNEVKYDGTYNGNTITIPNNQEGKTFTDEIDISTIGKIVDLDIKLNMDNGNVDYLGFSLKAPSGITYTLKSSTSGTSGAYYQTIFDDEANRFLFNGSPPYMGRFYLKDDNKLSRLDGQSITGKWKMIIYTRSNLSASIDWTLLFNYDNTAPSAPTNLVVAESGDTSVKLKWSQNSESDVSKYYIYKGTSTNPTTLIDSTNSKSDTTKLVTGLTTETKYYFRVKAVDHVWNISDYSNEVSVTPTHNPKIYVSKDGNDTGSYGLESAPFKTIAAAIIYSGEGDTIIVNEGTYSENLTLNKNVILTSNYYLDSDTSHISKTIIDGNKTGRVLKIAKDDNTAGIDTTAKIIGLTIQGGQINEFGQGIYINNSSPIIRKNIIQHNKSAPTQNVDCSGGGIMVGGSSNPIIEYNVIRFNEAFPSGGGIMVWLAGDETIIRRNQIYKNAVVDANNFGAYTQHGGGIRMHMGSLINNTIWDNLSDSVPNDLLMDKKQYLRNNIIGKIYHPEKDESEIRYNLSLDKLGGVDNIQDFPLFLDSLNNNYNLTFYSPARDAGDPNSPKDPDGTRADIGALYFDNRDNQPPTVAFTSNALNDKYKLGTKQNITWSTTDNFPTDTIKIKLEYSTNFSSGVWTKIADSLSNTGTYEWSVPNIPSSNGGIKVTATDFGGNTDADSSEKIFEIYYPSVTLQSLSNTTLKISEQVSIKWSTASEPLVELVDLYYTVDDGTNWKDMSLNEENDGDYLWTVPNEPTITAGIRIIAKEQFGYKDTADVKGLKIEIEYPTVTSVNPNQDNIWWDIKEIKFKTNIIFDSQTVNNNSVILTNSQADYGYSVTQSNDTITVKFASTLITYDSISIKLDASKIKSPFGYGLDGNGDGTPGDDYTIIKKVYMPIDYDYSGTINASDVSLFVDYFKSNDSKWETAPIVAGTVPYVKILPDGKYDIDDMLTFVQFGNWYLQGASGKVADDIGNTPISLDTTIQSKDYTVSFSKSTKAIEVYVKYDPLKLTPIIEPTSGEIKLGHHDTEKGIISLIVYNPSDENIRLKWNQLDKKSESDISVLVKTTDQNGQETVKRTMLKVISVPSEFALHDNYPNPFNPTTTFRFDVPEVSDVTLSIYNMLGQRVRTFNYQNTSAGYHSVTWDATNDLGEQVGAGVYLYQLRANQFVKTRKMVLLK